VVSTPGERVSSFIHSGFELTSRVCSMYRKDDFKNGDDTFKVADKYVRLPTNPKNS
jgi:hypothetical protein